MNVASRVRILIGISVAALSAGSIVFANDKSSEYQVTCRTPAGYLRVTDDAECKRKEIQVELPTADEYNTLVSANAELSRRVERLIADGNDLRTDLAALHSASNIVAADVNALKDADVKTVGDVDSLMRRLPKVSEHDGVLLMPRADLTKRDLSERNLSGADLTEANLWQASCWKANLSGTRLVGADLSDVQFLFADMTGANLTGAKLFSSDVRYTKMVGADLIQADLRYADFTGANFTGANFTGANFTGANFTGANFTGVKSAGITGSPASLPSGWLLVDGALVETLP